MRIHLWAKATAMVWLGGWLLNGSVPLEAWAASDSSFLVNVWTTEEGLPQNELTSILQTADGYLWLGTHSGLVRFDGSGFHPRLDQSNTPALESSHIGTLFEDREHQLWIGAANGGITLLRQGRAEPLSIGRAGRESRLAGACQDQSGAVWLYLANGQLWRYEHGHTNAYAVGMDRPSDYRGIIADTNGQVWIGMDGGVSALQWKGSPSGAGAIALEPTLPVNKLDYLLASSRGGYWRLGDMRIQKWSTNRMEFEWRWYPWEQKVVYSACEDREGNLVVGTLGAGVFWFNASGEATRISTRDGLSNDYILSLLVDREGDLWVGTDGGGLNRVKRPLFAILEPTRGLVVQSVSEDAQGGLWLGYGGAPLAYYKDGVVESYRLPVRAVLVDREQRVWVGTSSAIGGGLLLVQNKKPQPVPGFDPSLQFVTALHQDGRGVLWVGAQRGLARWDGQAWKTFTRADGLSSDMVQAIADDPEGNVWIGTSEGGLNCWRDGRWQVYRKESSGLPSDNISSLYVDTEGVLWIGTDGGGLARFQGGRWARYTRAEGLASNSIGYIIEDEQANLWIGSTGGLMRALKTALNDFANGRTNFIPCRVYGKSEGLPIRECTSGSQPGACRTGSGKFWFPTIMGLAGVDPAKLTYNPNPPPVRIESVTVDGQPRDWQMSALALNPRSQHIAIEYSSLNLAAPERARFKYWLEGHETTWFDAGNARIARYGKIPPGHYRFHVTACNEDGVWNPSGAMLAFTITPPFWRTWWFITVTAVTSLATVAGLVHYVSTQRLQRQVARLRQQEALEKERSRIARDIHDQLGASLTQVALLGELVESDKDEPGEVEEHARQISQTARDTTRVLDEIVWAVNPANDTVDGLMTYICKYTQEYLTVAGLQYRLEMPQQLPAVPLPPEVRHNVFLACKEAVTNIVRHAKATSVWVGLQLQANAFVLEIRDNGIGLGNLDEKAAQKRNGLRNMRNRMEEIGGEFGFAPAPGGGSLIRLTIPLQRAAV